MHDAPAVSCSQCQRGWNSAAMAEGLALLAVCPRCGGDLTFQRPPLQERETRDDARFERQPPHLVLGLPRGRRRSHHNLR